MTKVKATAPAKAKAEKKPQPKAVVKTPAPVKDDQVKELEALNEELLALDEKEKALSEEDRANPEIGGVLIQQIENIKVKLLELAANALDKNNKKGKKAATAFTPDKTRAKAVFANHAVDEVHFTTDGTAFIEPQFAHMHAGTLENPTVVTVKREEV